MGLLTGFNISEFRSSFKREPQRTSQFEVLMIPPASIVVAIGTTALSSAITGGNGGIARTLQDFRLRCSAINQPGKNISTFEYNPTVGPPVKIANGSSYDQIQLEVIMSQTGLERQLMQAWVEFIQPTMIYNTDVRYHDNYTGSLILNTYKSDGDISQVIRIGNAFPTAISSVEYSWQGVDQVASFRVAFACESIQSYSPHEMPSGQFSLEPIKEIDVASILTRAVSAITG